MKIQKNSPGFLYEKLIQLNRLKFIEIKKIAPMIRVVFATTSEDDTRVDQTKTMKVFGSQQYCSNLGDLLQLGLTTLQESSKLHQFLYIL